MTLFPLASPYHQYEADFLATGNAPERKLVSINIVIIVGGVDHASCFWNSLELGTL